MISLNQALRKGMCGVSSSRPRADKQHRATPAVVSPVAIAGNNQTGLRR